MMFKLLTEEEKEKVKGEYAARRAVVALGSFVAICLVGLIGLLPSYVLSTARQDEVKERTKHADAAAQQGDEEELQEWLAQMNKRLTVLNPKFDVDRPSDFIDAVLEEKISGIRITGLSWVKTDEPIALTLDGVASNRQNLIAFENQIKDSGHFSGVILPISNLAQDRDIVFQLKFSFAPHTLNQ